MVGLEEKIFKTKVLRWLENDILTFVFANTVTPLSSFNICTSTIYL